MGKPNFRDELKRDAPVRYSAILSPKGNNSALYPARYIVELCLIGYSQRGRRSA